MKKLLPILLLISVLAGAFFWGRASRSQEVANWRKAAQEALAAREGYLATVDSLRGREQAARARFEALRSDYRHLAAYSDSLGQIADTASQVGPVRNALLAERASGAVCRATLAVADSGWSACGQRAALAEARAARLDSLLRVGVKVTQCRILLFPCPSRTAMFFLGTGAGIAASRVLK